MKKLLIAFLAVATGLTMIPMFAAFEAHVINVTAQIENALSVTTDKIDFGTVFPQEHLEKPLGIALSQSFLDEGRTDDVDYFIRQKPKCGVTENDGQDLVGETWTGHVVPTPNGAAGEFEVDCNQDMPDTVRQEFSVNTDGLASEFLLPSLCPYISKEGPDDNDETTPSFHEPWTIDNDGEIDWTDTPGRLAKSENDTSDEWIIDLAVPCFGGQCAQDWAEFVEDINPDADADRFVQPTDNEHKVFGCNLWVEVGNVSETPRGDLSITESTDDEALAEWSTENTTAGNSLSAHLRVNRQDNQNGDEARLTILASDVGISTLNDLDTIQWEALNVSGYAPHVDVIVDTDDNGTKDDALVFEYAKVDPNNCDDSGSYPTGPVSTFAGKGIVDSGAYAWLSSGPAGPCGDATFNANHMSLADWKTASHPSGIDGSTTVLRLEIEVDNWIADSEAFVNDVLVNGI